MNLSLLLLLLLLLLLSTFIAGNRERERTALDGELSCFDFKVGNNLPYIFFSWLAGWLAGRLSLWTSHKRRLNSSPYHVLLLLFVPLRRYVLLARYSVRTFVVVSWQNHRWVGWQFSGGQRLERLYKKNRPPSFCPPTYTVAVVVLFPFIEPFGRIRLRHERTTYYFLWGKSLADRSEKEE